MLDRVLVILLMLDRIRVILNKMLLILARVLMTLLMLDRIRMISGRILLPLGLAALVSAARAANGFVFLNLSLYSGSLVAPKKKRLLRGWALRADGGQHHVSVTRCRLVGPSQAATCHT